MSVIECTTEDILTEIGEGELRPGDELAAPADLARAFGCTVADAEEVLRLLEITHYVERTEDGYRVRQNPGADPELIPARRRPRRRY